MIQHFNKMKLNILFLLFLYVFCHAEENWNEIFTKSVARMTAETMTCTESCRYRNGNITKTLILQKKQDNGSVLRLEEKIDKNGIRKKREELPATKSIIRTYYTPEGEYSLIIRKEHCTGMLRVGGIVILPFPFLYNEISGKEIAYHEKPCWEITVKLIDNNGERKFVLTIDKDSHLVLKVGTTHEDGKLFSITEYSDFNFSPVIEEDAFVIPSDAKITKVNTPREAALTWEEIILKDAHETINVVGKEIKPQTSRWTSFWRKVKRNPSPYIIGVALALAGISFGTATILKRREKKQ